MNSEVLEFKVKSLTSSLEIFKENLVVKGSCVPPFIRKDEIKLMVIGQAPFCNQPSMRKAFYKGMLGHNIEYVREKAHI